MSTCLRGEEMHFYAIVGKVILTIILDIIIHVTKSRRVEEEYIKCMEKF